MELRGYAAQRSGAHPIIHGCGWRSFYLRARSRLFQTDHAPTGVLLACHHSRVGSHPLLFRVCYSRSQDLSMLHASSRYPLRPPCACVGRCVRLRAGPAEEATRERPSSRASPRRECPAPRRTATASNRWTPTCHTQVSPRTKHSLCLWHARAQALWRVSRQGCHVCNGKDGAERCSALARHAHATQSVKVCRSRDLPPPLLRRYSRFSGILPRVPWQGTRRDVRRQLPRRDSRDETRR